MKSVPKTSPESSRRNGVAQASGVHRLHTPSRETCWSKLLPCAMEAIAHFGSIGVPDSQDSC